MRSNFGDKKWKRGDWSWEMGGWGATASRCGVSVQDDEEILEADRGDGCTT